jgi:hypothetical protein
MDPITQNQQPTQPAAAPQAQPDLGAPIAPAYPQQPAAPAPAEPFAQPAKTIIVKFEEDLQFTITADVVDDMRFMELYAEVSEDQLKITKLIKWLLGEKQYESIFTYYESRGQKFTITKFGEVFEKLDKDLNANPDFLSR